MLRSTPFILFDGNCAEAMTFYQRCFGGELRLTRLADTPMKHDFPPEKHERIINAHLQAGDVAISATDWMASPQYEPVQGDAFAVFITGATQSELQPAFDRLAEGAREDRFQPLHEMPFGVYGQLYDRFGVHWIFKGDTAQ